MWRTDYWNSYQGATENEIKHAAALGSITEGNRKGDFKNKLLCPWGKKKKPWASGKNLFDNTPFPRDMG